MKTLFHLCTDPNGHPKPAVFVDGNGFKYTVPYDDPTEIQSSYMADKIVEHCHYFGIVEVHTTRTRAGISYDMDDARARALESLEISEKTCIDDYIRVQLEDRVRQNFPPLPPVGRALECCVKHKYNLLRAGIRCIGWEPPYQMQDPGFAVTATMSQAGNMDERITQLQTQLLKQNELIMQLLTGRGPSSEQRKAADKGKGKAADPVPSEAVESDAPQQSVTL